MSRCLVFASMLLVLALVVGCGGDKRDAKPQAPSAQSESSPKTVFETHPPANPPEYIGAYSDAEKRVVTWLETNPGDYNRDGEVSGQDVFPLAVHFGEHSNFNGFIEDAPLNGCIDGNRDGTLNGLDLFSISVHFGSEVTGFNLYKSTDEGGNWTLVEGSPFPREAPASFLCHHRGRYDDPDGLFEPAWYYVTSVGGSESKAPGETDPSDIVTEVEEEIVTMDQQLTGNQQNVIDGLCFGVRLDEAIAGEGDSVTTGFVNNLEQLEGVPALGQAFYTEFTTGGLGGDFIVRMPFLPRDIFSLEIDDVGLMYFQPETKMAGSWVPVDPDDFETTQTGDGEGYIEYLTDLPFVMLGLYNAGLLRAEIHSTGTTGDAPLDPRFSCAARGGEFPYTYTWMIDGLEDQSGPSHRYNPIFITPGTFEITCEVEDALGDTWVTDPIEVQVTGGAPWTISQVFRETFVDGPINLLLDQDDNPVILVKSNAGLELLWWQGSFFKHETITPDANFKDFCLALDAADTPHISYKHKYDDNLIHLSGNGIGWDAEYIDAGADNGAGNFIAFDNGGTLHATYLSEASDGLIYATKDGGWTGELVEGGLGYASFFPRAPFCFNALDLPVVAYYDRGNGDLKLATYSGAFWETETLDDVEDVGNFPSILQINGLINIGYVDSTSNALRFIRDTGVGWDYSTPDFLEYIQYQGLAEAPSGMPALAYCGDDVLFQTHLKYAEFDGAAWTLDDITTDAASASSADLVFDSTGMPIIAYFDWVGQHVMIASRRDFTYSADVTPPFWPTTVGAQQAVGGNESVTVRWNAADDAQSLPVSYNLYYDDSTPVDIGGDAVRVTGAGEIGSGGYDWEHTVEGLTGGRQYWFVVRAEDAADTTNEDANTVEVSARPTGGADTIPPQWSTNTGIQRADRGNGLVHCEWGDALDADSPPVKWNVYYDTQSPIRFGSGAVRLADVPASSGDFWAWGYDVPGLTNGTEYWFAVRAEDSAVPANEDTNIVELSATPSESLFDWTIEFADPGTDVGQYTSIAFNWLNPHISYYDVTNQDLKMTWRENTTGVWSDEIVDSTGNVGRYTSIAYTGNPGVEISYQDPGEDTLKRAVGTPGSWTIDTPWAEQEIGEYSSILATWTDTWIAHQHWEGEDLLFSHFDGTSWNNETVVDTGPNGWWTSIARNNANGQINISYYKAGSFDDLEIATLEGISWSIETVDSTGDVGSYSACSGTTELGMGISYYDATNGDLKVAFSPGGVWSTETVDSTGDVGQHTSCKGDYFGGFTVVYYDVTNGDLKIAFWDTTQWTIEVIDSVGDVGQYTDIDIEAESGLIGISYYDVTNGRLKYAQSNNPLSPW